MGGSRWRKSDRLDAINADERDREREYITAASVLALDPMVAAVVVSTAALSFSWSIITRYVVV